MCSVQRYAVCVVRARSAARSAPQQYRSMRLGATTYAFARSSKRASKQYRSVWMLLQSWSKRFSAGGTWLC